MPRADHVALTLASRRNFPAGTLKFRTPGGPLDRSGRKSVLQACHDRKRGHLRHAWLKETGGSGAAGPCSTACQAPAQRHQRLYSLDLELESLVFFTCDVDVRSERGASRLRRIARFCDDRGQRMRFSAFECEVDPAHWTAMRSRLVDAIDSDTDSLRCRFLGRVWRRRVEHVGTKPSEDPDDLRRHFENRAPACRGSQTGPYFLVESNTIVGRGRPVTGGVDRNVP